LAIGTQLVGRDSFSPSLWYILDFNFSKILKHQILGELVRGLELLLLRGNDAALDGNALEARLPL